MKNRRSWAPRHAGRARGPSLARSPRRGPPRASRMQGQGGNRIGARPLSIFIASRDHRGPACPRRDRSQAFSGQPSAVSPGRCGTAGSGLWEFAKKEVWTAQAVLPLSRPEATLPADGPAQRGFTGKRREHRHRIPPERGNTRMSHSCSHGSAQSRALIAPMNAYVRGIARSSTCHQAPAASPGWRPGPAACGRARDPWSLLGSRRSQLGRTRVHSRLGTRRSGWGEVAQTYSRGSGPNDSI